MRFFWDIVRVPVAKAGAGAKSGTKHTREPLAQVLQASLLMAGAFAVAVSAHAFNVRSIALAGAMAFAVMVLFVLVLAALLQSVLRIAKVPFPATLRMAGESMSVLSGGMFVASLLLFLPSGAVIAALALLPFVATSFAVLYGQMRSHGVEAALAVGALAFSFLSIALAIFAVRLLVLFGALGTQLFP